MKCEAWEDQAIRAALITAWCKEQIKPEIFEAGKIDFDNSKVLIVNFLPPEPYSVNPEYSNRLVCSAIVALIADGLTTGCSGIQMTVSERNSDNIVFKQCAKYGIRENVLREIEHAKGNIEKKVADMLPQITYRVDDRRGLRKRTLTNGRPPMPLP